MSEVEQADFPCQKNHPRRRKNSWSSPAPNGTKGGAAVGNRDPFVIIAVGRPNLSRISREITVWHIILAGTNERLGPRWRAICPLHECAGTRRETAHLEFGEARHGIQSVQGTMVVLVEREEGGRCRWASCSGCIDHWGGLLLLSWMGQICGWLAPS